MTAQLIGGKAAPHVSIAQNTTEQTSAAIPKRPIAHNRRYDAGKTMCWKIKAKNEAARAARLRTALPYGRLNTSVPLVPPKPKLFFTATSIFMSRAVLAQ